MDAEQTLKALREHVLVDGFDFVLDLDASHGVRLVDARDGTGYLDMFSFFASNALGMNHPRMREPDVEEALLRAARHKPSNSDIYTVEYAAFVDEFSRTLGDPRLPHLFFIEGGALAVENALKTAFDWKSRKNEEAGRDPHLGTKVIHLTDAFHGRSGYTMSLTNTDPTKIARFPKFPWPRVDSPALQFPLDEFEHENEAAERHALRQIEQAFARHPHDIACFIAEPIQAEGGDRHLSARFLRQVQDLCHAHDALFVLDEVQTGVGLTGTPWLYQQLGLEPDIVAFGKKTHVCGIMAGGRVDEIDDNVFRVSSRLNSTFGGNLVDMVRATYMLEVIREDGLIAGAAGLGDHLLTRLQELERDHEFISNARGRGLMCAFDVPDRDARDEVVGRLFAEQDVMILGCGDHSVRFRPPLTVQEDHLDEAIDALEHVLRGID